MRNININDAALRLAGLARIKCHSGIVLSTKFISAF